MAAGAAVTTPRPPCLARHRPVRSCQAQYAGVRSAGCHAALWPWPAVAGSWQPPANTVRLRPLQAPARRLARRCTQHPASWLHARPRQPCRCSRTRPLPAAAPSTPHPVAPAKLGGYSRCACMMTCTSLLALGSTTPLLGRTQYFLGLVVFTLNATRSSVGFCSVRVTGMFLRSSNLRVGGWAAQRRAAPRPQGAGQPIPGPTHRNLSSVGETRR